VELTGLSVPLKKQIRVEERRQPPGFRRMDIDSPDGLRNQWLFVLNAFGADRRRKSESAFRANTPRVRRAATNSTVR
jgi:hypothetical protein